jgi:predicted DNA-binding transcriptional regulator YafY
VGKPGAFDRPSTAVPGGPAEPWQFREEEPVTARLLVDAGHAAWVRRHLDTATGTVALAERADGSVVADVVVTNWPAFRSFVLTFLEHAEVLAPPALRADLVAWLEHSVTTADAGADRP